MKFTLKVMLMATLPFFALSCSNEAPAEKETTPTTETQAAPETVKNGSADIDLAASTIHWKGYKIMGNHTGTINLSEANLQFDNGNITGGHFIADMKSVKVTDLMDDGEEEEEAPEEVEEDKNDLAGHLMDGDFFDAGNFPTAKFEITNAEASGNAYQITGNMTIKDVTDPVTFVAKLDNNTFTATVPVDRTKFGVKYGSGTFFENLGDRAIKDVFDLEVSLKLK